MPPESEENVNPFEQKFASIMGQVVDVLAKVEHTNTKLLEHQQASSRQPAAPQPPAKPTPPTVDKAAAAAAVEAMLQGDLGPLREQLAGQAMNPAEFAQLKSQLDQLTEFAKLQATETIPQNEAHFRAQVDKRWGAGAFDTIFKEALDAKFSEQPGLRASRSYLENAINLVAGEKLDDLLEFKSKSDAAQKDAADKDKTSTPAYPFMLGNGVPIQMKDGKVHFDGEDEAWITKFEAHNGTPFPREGASAMLGALMKTSQGKPMVTASIDELQKLIPQEGK